MFAEFIKKKLFQKSPKSAKVHQGSKIKKYEVREILEFRISETILLKKASCEICLYCIPLLKYAKSSLAYLVRL